MTARSPLVDRREDLERIAAAEVPFLTQLDVRVEPTSAERLGFPLTPNTWARTGDREVLWLGPDEWLVVAEPGTAEALSAELDGALAGEHRSIVDVSAARAVFDLERHDRHDLLASACPLDLHPRSWGDGRCAQTVFGATQVLLQERGATTRVFVRPSFARYVLDLLLAALG